MHKNTYVCILQNKRPPSTTLPQQTLTRLLYPWTDLLLITYSWHHAIIIIYSLILLPLSILPRLIIIMLLAALILLNYMPLCAHTIDQYTYTADLLAMAACENPHLPPLPCALYNITTPLNHNSWTTCLSSHPDRALVRYILGGTKYGFRIGFQYSTSSITSASTNHPSANNKEATQCPHQPCQRPPVIYTRYLDKNAQDYDSEPHGIQLHYAQVCFPFMLL